MKCPKCGYVSFNYLDRCKKCGRDLVAFKAEHNLWGIKPGTLSIYSSIQQALEREEPQEGRAISMLPSLDELSDMEEGLPHDIEMIEEEDEEPAVSQDALSPVIPEAELEGIHLDLGEIDLEGGGGVMAPQAGEEEPDIELEMISLEEDVAKGTQNKELPGGSPPLKESPMVIDLDLEEIELEGGEPEEKEPLLELVEEAEDGSDLLDLDEIDEIELSWEEEEKEEGPGKKGGS